MNWSKWETSARGGMSTNQDSYQFCHVSNVSRMCNDSSKSSIHLLVASIVRKGCCKNKLCLDKFNFLTVLFRHT